VVGEYTGTLITGQRFVGAYIIAVRKQGPRWCFTAGLEHEPVEEVRAMPSLYPQQAPTNTLFYGDNLDILRKYIGFVS